MYVRFLKAGRNNTGLHNAFASSKIVVNNKFCTSLNLSSLVQRPSLKIYGQPYYGNQLVLEKFAEQLRNAEVC